MTEKNIGTKRILLSVGTVLGYATIAVGFAMMICILEALFTK